MHGLRDGAENHPGLRKLFLEGSDNRDGIEHGIDRDPAIRADARESLLFAQRNAELGVDLKELRIDVFERLRAGRCLGRRIIVNVLKIDLWIVDPRPARLGHC